MNATEFAGGHSHGRAKGPGKSAVVIETALLRDVGHRAVGFAQEARGNLQTCPGDELTGRPTYPPDSPSEALLKHHLVNLKKQAVEGTLRRTTAK